MSIPQMDRRALTALLLLSCAPADLAAVEREFVASGLAALHVEADAADVRIEAGEADVLRLAWSSRGPGRVDVEEIDGELHVRATCETLLPCALDLTLHVPVDLAIVVRADGGDVRLHGLSGDVDVEVAGGDVVGRALQAPVLRARAGLGGADLAWVVRPVDVVVAVGVGDIRITVPEGSYDLDLAGFGESIVRGVDSDVLGPRVRAHTASGQVRIDGS